MAVALYKLTSEKNEISRNLFPYHGIEVSSFDEEDVEFARKDLEDQAQIAVGDPTITATTLGVYHTQEDMTSFFGKLTDTNGWPIVVTNENYGPHVV